MATESRSIKNKTMTSATKNIGLGALKPDKVRERKVTDKASGHMPAGHNDRFGNRKA